jgi:hypothetical protein
LLAEVSNPCLIMRTFLKIRGGLKGTAFYKYNEYCFVVIFLIARAIVTPLVMFYIYEADRVIYGTKFGVAFVLFVQYFWVYRVLNMAANQLHEAKPENLRYEKFLKFTNTITKNKKVGKILATVNFMWIFVLPHYYYGFVRKTLFNFI